MHKPYSNFFSILGAVVVLLVSIVVVEAEVATREVIKVSEVVVEVEDKVAEAIVGAASNLADLPLPKKNH
jgi:hypothetical protein